MDSILVINQKINITIEKIMNGGEGLGYYNNFAVFVPMSAISDNLNVKIISVKKSYARALIEDIVEPSSDRIDDHSKITFEDFQGCDFAMLNYDAQIKYKKLIVEDAIKKIGKLENVLVLDTIKSDAKKHYRNKIIEPFSSLNGKIITGFFKRKSHEIFEVNENILNTKLGNKIIENLKIILNKNRLDVYSEKNHTGILRNILVRTNSKDEAMVALIVNSKKIEKKVKEILMELKKISPEVKSIFISVNTKKTNVVMGDRNILIWGEKTLKEAINGINFNISPTSFFQINLPQTKKLYDIATSLFENIESQTIVDAYAGTGTLGMLLAKKAKQIYSIEMSKSSTLDGVNTAKENNIKNIEFINGKVENEIQKLIDNNIKIDGIIFDPPRKGIDEKILNIVADKKIQEIVYISCNPSTLARDLSILSSLGYKIGDIQPVDMFPQTSHIECVVKLTL